MEEIIKKVKNKKYDLRDIDLLSICHFKINDEIISVEELKKIKDLIDKTIENLEKGEIDG